MLIFSRIRRRLHSHITCRTELAKRLIEYTEQGVIPTDATAYIFFRHDCGHHQMHWANKLLSTRFVQDLPSDTPTACIIFQRTKYDENKRGKKRQCRHTYMYTCAQEHNRWCIQHFGKCKLGLWIELICREFPICSWPTLLECYKISKIYSHGQW